MRDVAIQSLLDERGIRKAIEQCLPDGWKVEDGPMFGFCWPRIAGGVYSVKMDVLLRCGDLVWAFELPARPEDVTRELAVERATEALAKAEIYRQPQP